MTTIRVRSRRAGFTLIEALLALVLATLLFGDIAMYTGTWMRHWGTLVQRGSQEDVVAIVLDRIVEDLEEAQPVYTGVNGDTVRFEGSAEEVTFVRPALGFNARAGLDTVTYLDGYFSGDPAILRSRRGFSASGEEAEGGEDLPLIRGDTRVSFAYSSADGSEQSTSWTNTRRLPSLVRVEISGKSPRPWQQFAYARLRAEMPANCAAADKAPRCRDRLQ